MNDLSRKRLEEIARQATMIANSNDDPVCRLAELVRDVADAVAQTMPPDAPPELQVGETYELVLRVRAMVVELVDGSYSLQLDTRDHLAGREVSIDVDEVIEAISTPH